MLIGIIVADVLALIEIAIYLGMMANATAVIRHTDADILVASKNIQSFGFALPFPAERRLCRREHDVDVKVLRQHCRFTFTFNKEQWI